MRRRANLFCEPWLMTRSAFDLAAQAWETVLEKPEGFFSFLTDDAPATPELAVRSGVAVIPIQGPLIAGPPDLFSILFGATTFETITAQVAEALTRPNLKGIVLDVNSPGGQAVGPAAVSAAIYEARRSLPISAVTPGEMASAAYWIASAADEVVLARDSLAGSIGTVARFRDFSESESRRGVRTIAVRATQSPRKQPDPTTDDGRAEFQALVDDLTEVFLGDVARNRGVSVATVTQDFGQGAVFVGRKAIAAGLADRIGTVESEIARLASL